MGSIQKCQSCDTDKKKDTEGEGYGPVDNNINGKPL
jgi:hypothetical protein